jgi:hypothetical protein
MVDITDKMFKALNRCAAGKVKRVRWGGSGKAKLHGISRSMFRKLKQHGLINVYGMSRTGPCVGSVVPSTRARSAAFASQFRKEVAA